MAGLSPCSPGVSQGYSVLAGLLSLRSGKLPSCVPFVTFAHPGGQVCLPWLLYPWQPGARISLAP
eukprot:scaffold85031_cov54-Phaeocystis_antarctica.AAC.1